MNEHSVLVLFSVSKHLLSHVIDLHARTENEVKNHENKRLRSTIAILREDLWFSRLLNNGSAEISLLTAKKKKKKKKKKVLAPANVQAWRTFEKGVAELSKRGGRWRASTQAWRGATSKCMCGEHCVNRPVRSVLESAATAKKIKHKQACADRRADFTPFVCSTDGAVHREGQHFLRRLAARLATKWEMPYARVMNFVRTRLSIAILRATGHCVRGARRKFFSLSTDGGLAVALFS